MIGLFGFGIGLIIIPWLIIGFILSTLNGEKEDYSKPQNEHHNNGVDDMWVAGFVIERQRQLENEKEKENYYG